MLYTVTGYTVTGYSGTGYRMSQYQGVVKGVSHCYRAHCCKTHCYMAHCYRTQYVTILRQVQDALHCNTTHCFRTQFYKTHCYRIQWFQPQTRANRIYKTASIMYKHETRIAALKWVECFPYFLSRLHADVLLISGRRKPSRARVWFSALQFATLVALHTASANP